MVTLAKIYPSHLEWHLQSNMSFIKPEEDVVLRHHLQMFLDSKKNTNISSLHVTICVLRVFWTMQKLPDFSIFLHFLFWKKPHMPGNSHSIVNYLGYNIYPTTVSFLVCVFHLLRVFVAFAHLLCIQTLPSSASELQFVPQIAVLPAGRGRPLDACTCGNWTVELSDNEMLDFVELVFLSKYIRLSYMILSTCIYTNIYKYIHPQIPRLGRSHQSCLKTPADNGRSLLFWCSTSSINPKTNQIALEIVATKYIAINVQKITMTSCGTLPQEFQNKLCYLG